MAMFTNTLQICFTIVSLSALFLESHGDQQLKLAQVVYRHGDRSSIIPYPKDTHNLTEWAKEGAYGYGQLTYLGKKQHYELGQWFQKRYVEDKNLLPAEYNVNKIYVRSTDVDRTLMSAYSNLAGFFPPGPEQQWWPQGANISWQPVPVHTVPQLQDNLLSMDTPCAMADQLYKQEMETKEFKKMSAENKALLDFVANKTGKSHEDIDNVWEIIDTLFCETQHNMTQPAWVNSQLPGSNSSQTVYEQLLELNSWEFDLKFGEPDKKARLRGGPLLKQMIENMKNSSDVKFYMYSAHDNTVMAFLHALRVSNRKQPPYTATVIVELYTVKDNSTANASMDAVQVWYRNESNHDAYPMTIPGCKTLKTDAGDEMCPYDQFVKLTASMIPDDWEAECAVPEPRPYNPGFIIGIGVGAAFVFIMIVIGIVFIIKKKKRTGYNYEGLNVNA